MKKNQNLKFAFLTSGVCALTLAACGHDMSEEEVLAETQDNVCMPWQSCGGGYGGSGGGDEGGGQEDPPDEEEQCTKTTFPITYTDIVATKGDLDGHGGLDECVDIYTDRTDAEYMNRWGHFNHFCTISIAGNATHSHTSPDTIEATTECAPSGHINFEATITWNLVCYGC